MSEILDQTEVILDITNFNFSDIDAKQTKINTIQNIGNHVVRSIEASTKADEWQKSGLCNQTDPESFYPEKGGSVKHAKQICQGCEVRSECLEFALANNEVFGVWGGLTVEERIALQKLRRAS